MTPSHEKSEGFREFKIQTILRAEGDISKIEWECESLMTDCETEFEEEGLIERKVEKTAFKP